MALTQAQRAILKADIDQDPVLSVLPNSNANGDVIAAAYNTVGTFVVWQTAVKVKDVQDGIVWQNLTPADVPDGTLLWNNRSLACQGKQFNVQTILVGRDYIDATKANVRAGLQDALTNVPSGVSGALLSGGWANVKTALQRVVTRAEKLFATGTGTAASPGLVTFEGKITQDDVTMARDGA